MKDGRVSGINTSKGSMPADVLVLAAGTGTTKLARLAGVNMPLKESAGLLAHILPLPRILDRIGSPPAPTSSRTPIAASSPEPISRQQKQPGFAPQRPNLYIAAMHSSMTSPIIGEMAAMEILDGTTADILDTFRPARFA